MKALWNWMERHPARAGTLAGWFQQFASGITTLTIIPLITGRLSPTEAGLWFSFQSLTMIVTFTDFGIGFALARQVAFSLGGGQRTENDDFLAIRPGWGGISDLDAAMRVILRRMVATSVVLLILIHEVIFPFTRLDPSPTPASVATWYLLGSSAILLVYVKRYQAFLEGMGRLHLCRLLSGLYQFTAGVAAILALLLTEQLVWMALAVAVSTAIFGISLKVFFRQFTATRCEFVAQPPPGLVRGLWKVATPMGIVSVAGYCVNAVQVPLIGSILGPALVPPYYAAQKIGQMLNVAISQLIGPQLPLFTMEYAQGAWTSARSRMIRAFFLTFALAGLVNIVFFLGSSTVADWWLGPNRFVDSRTLGILGLDYFLSTTTVALGQFVLASGSNPFMWSTLAMGMLNLGFCAAFGLHFGLPGVAISSLAAGICTNYWLLIFHGRRLEQHLRGELVH